MLVCCVCQLMLGNQLRRLLMSCPPSWMEDVGPPPECIACECSTLVHPPAAHPHHVRILAWRGKGNVTARKVSLSHVTQHHLATCCMQNDMRCFIVKCCRGGWAGDLGGAGSSHVHHGQRPQCHRLCGCHRLLAALCPARQARPLLPALRTLRQCLGSMLHDWHGPHPGVPAHGVPQ